MERLDCPMLKSGGTWAINFLLGRRYLIAAGWWVALACLIVCSRNPTSVPNLTRRSKYHPKNIENLKDSEFSEELWQ